jgi:inhibitor of cysteine peptidase
MTTAAPDISGERGRRRSMTELNLTTVDNNKSVPARVGDIIIIRLPENATTGYRWDVLSFTQGQVELESRAGTSTLPGAMGAGASESVFRFRVNALGQANITLKLWRGYESDASVFKFQVQVTIS